MPNSARIMAERTDCVLYGGSILAHPSADSIALRDGMIAAIGAAEEVLRFVSDSTPRIDLRGRAVLPGFIDAHVHLLSTGLSELGWLVDLAGRSRSETLAVLEQAVAERGGGEWVVGIGWDESQWDDPRYLTARELDRLAPRSPLGAVRRDGHLLVVNTSALRMIRASIPSAVGGEDVDETRREFREAAAWSVLEAIDPDQDTLVEALAAAVRRCHRLGVTTVHTMCPPRRVRVLLDGRTRNRLRVVIYRRVAEPADVSAGDSDLTSDTEWARVGGLKIFADGSIGARNAALSEPYCNGGSGGLTHDDETLRELIERADAAGWQTAVHAIGDRAIEQVLRAHAKIGSASSLRHRIEHLELPSDAQIEWAQNLGLCVSMQPNFIGNWSGPNGLYERHLGEARDAFSNPLRRVVDAGLPLGFGSDGMPMSPVYGLHCAVNGPHPSQRLTVEEAIAGYTTGGAYLAFEENAKGRLDVGMYADVVVLDEDPRRSPERLNDRSVEMTFVGGACVYARERGARA
jgi:predicted amidohydrolase YtcJ